MSGSLKFKCLLRKLDLPENKKDMIRDQDCLVSSAVKESSDMGSVYTKSNRSKSNRGGGEGGGGG